MAIKKTKLVSDIFEFDDSTECETEWRGMPEFNQPDNGAFKQIIVSFDDQDGIDKFAALLNLNINAKTKSLWYPPRPKNYVSDLFYFDDADTVSSNPEEANVKS